MRQVRSWQRCDWRLQVSSLRHRPSAFPPFHEMVAVLSSRQPRNAPQSVEHGSNMTTREQAVALQTSTLYSPCLPLYASSTIIAHLIHLCDDRHAPREHGDYQ